MNLTDFEMPFVNNNKYNTERTVCIYRNTANKQMLSSKQST
jgi:hypothetical protein